jgi:hypothetical protein
MQDHEMKMFNSIMGTIKDVLNDESTQNSLISISKAVNADICQPVTDIMITACTYGVYNAMVFVQKSIEDRFIESINTINNNMLVLKSDIEVQKYKTAHIAASPPPNA